LILLRNPLAGSAQYARSFAERAAMIIKMDKYEEYIGISYEQASREAQRLIDFMGWYQSLDRLIELKRIMTAHQRVRLAVQRDMPASSHLDAS
jgi:hypothetical protein